MTFENLHPAEDSLEKSDEISVHTFTDPEATQRDLQRKHVSKLKVLLGMGAAFIGYADRGNLQAAEPINAFAVNNAKTSESMDVSADLKALTPEDILLKTEQGRAYYRKKFENDLSRIEKSTGQARGMQARLLIPRLMEETKKPVSDFEKVAINELLYKMAVLAGKHNPALQANRILTPDDQFMTGVYFEKEVEILEEAKKHPLNTSLFAVVNEINAAIKERKAILDSMKVLVENPADADRNQQIGEYIFKQDIPKSLPYLAKGTKPHLRIVAAKSDDAKEWWSQSYNETDADRVKAMRAYSLSLYVADPSKYSQEDRNIFDGLVKSNQHLMKTDSSSRRVSIAVHGADAADTVVAASSSSPAPKPEVAKNNGAWINLTQAVDLRKSGANGAIVPDGQGGLLFKGKDVSSATLDYPFLINGEYDVAFEFTEIAGTGTYAFVIPVADAQCMIMKMNDFVGIDMVKGERAMVNKTKKVVDLKPGVPHKVIIQVRKGEEPMSAVIKLTIDDELLIDYQGPLSELSVTKGWDRGKNVFAIGNNQTNLRVGPVGFLPQKGTMIVPKGN